MAPASKPSMADQGATCVILMQIMAAMSPEAIDTYKRVLSVIYKAAIRKLDLLFGASPDGVVVEASAWSGGRHVV